MPRRALRTTGAEVTGLPESVVRVVARRMYFQPILAVGFITSGPQGSERPLGTCFAFRNDNTYLTAAHCARDLPIQVHLPPRYTVSIDRVVRHPTADVAALIASPEAHGAAVPYASGPFEWARLLPYDRATRPSMAMVAASASDSEQCRLRGR